MMKLTEHTISNNINKDKLKDLDNKTTKYFFYFLIFFIIFFFLIFYKYINKIIYIYIIFNI